MKAVKRSTRLISPRKMGIGVTFESSPVVEVQFPREFKDSLTFVNISDGEITLEATGSLAIDLSTGEIQ